MCCCIRTSPPKLTACVFATKNKEESVLPEIIQLIHHTSSFLLRIFVSNETFCLVRGTAIENTRSFSKFLSRSRIYHASNHGKERRNNEYRLKLRRHSEILSELTFPESAVKEEYRLNREVRLESHKMRYPAILSSFESF